MEMQANESKEDLKSSQEYENRGIVLLDDINEKEMNGPRVASNFQKI